MLTTADYLRLPEVAPDAVIRYGADADAFVHLYRPAGAGPHPVAIVLHGGCWEAPYGLEPLGGLCRALAHEGIAAWSVEYRRIGGGGGWPATFGDVAAAADAVRTHAHAHALDPARAIALGHSAGGHLALWLATRASLPAGHALRGAAPLALRGVVGLAAIADLAAARREGICGGDVVAALLGGEPEAVPDRLALGSPAARLPLRVPHRHVVGANDPIVPPPHVRAFVDAARAAGDDARIDVLPHAGHFEPVLPHGAAWPAVRDAARELAGLRPRGGEWQAQRRGS